MQPVRDRRWHADGSLTARSVWCTQLGCEVHWHPESDEYVCPCHDGRFDAAGRPIAGPPARPLGQLAVRLDGERVVIPHPIG